MFLLTKTRLATQKIKFSVRFFRLAVFGWKSWFLAVFHAVRVLRLLSSNERSWNLTVCIRKVFKTLNKVKHGNKYQLQSGFKEPHLLNNPKLPSVRSANRGIILDFVEKQQYPLVYLRILLSSIENTVFFLEKCWKIYKSVGKTLWKH